MRQSVPCYLAVLLAGCVPVFSLNPLYTKETITFDERLLGIWLTDPNRPEDIWEFARLEAGAAERLPIDLQDEAAKCYRVKFTDRNGTVSIVACLVKLQERLFLNFLPARLPGGELNPESIDILNAMFFLRVHTFARVDFPGDQLKISLTFDNKFKDLLQAEPKAVTYAMVKESPAAPVRKGGTVKEHPVLTASTAELQAFLARYAGDERLFPNDLTLVRKSR